MKLQNLVTIITGSSSNIGEATAKLFAQEGSKVVITALKNEAGAKRVTEEIVAAGGDAFYIMGDLSREEVVKELFDKTIEKFGTVDVLINNAGHGHDKDILESTREDWVAAFDDCLFNAVLCSKYAAKIMLEKKSGVILNTSSIRGIPYAGREGLIAYSCAKAALASFTQTLAKRLAPMVRVNAVAPGFVYKEMYDNFPKALSEKLINSTLLKRYNTVDEIADAFLYLATAKGVTGEILTVDGGFQLKQE